MASQRQAKTSRNQKGKKPNNIYGYYAVKYIADGIAHYKMRNPVSFINDFLKEETDISKYDIRMEDDGADLILYIEGDIGYLNEVMNMRVLLEELNIDTTEWSKKSISQLSRFTIKTDSNGQHYSSINHQRSMTDIEVNIIYDDVQNNMNLSILAPAWKCTAKTQELVNKVVDVIHDNIMHGSTPLHKDIISCFNDFNNEIQMSHPSSGSSKVRYNQVILKDDKTKETGKDNSTQLTNRFSTLEIND
jgi:hypothetical protein